jgi:hypothetical protein
MIHECADLDDFATSFGFGCHAPISCLIY